MTTPRRRAREAALRALYLWQIGGTAPAVAVETYFAAHDPDAPAAVVEFASTLVHGTASAAEDLDRLIAANSANWRLERLAVIDRLILRMAIWELQHDPETPPAVVLNEAVELARRFSGEEATRFVNGVLDAVRKTLPAAG